MGAITYYYTLSLEKKTPLVFGSYTLKTLEDSDGLTFYLAYGNIFFNSTSSFEMGCVKY